MYDELRAYVGASEADAAFIVRVADEASALVAQFVGTAPVPAAIRDRAVLEVGSELFHRRQAPNGVAQFSTFDGAAIRVARDPMVGAYPLLQRYVGLGVA